MTIGIELGLLYYATTVPVLCPDEKMISLFPFYFLLCVKISFTLLLEFSSVSVEHVVDLFLKCNVGIDAFAYLCDVNVI